MSDSLPLSQSNWHQKIQLILIIHIFRRHEFTHSLKFIYNPKINTHGAFVGIPRHVQSSKNLNWAVDIVPAEVNQGRTSDILFHLSYSKLGPFLSIFSATFLCFFLVTSPLKWPVNLVLNYCLVSLSTQRLWCAFWRKYMC